MSDTSDVIKALKDNKRLVLGTFKEEVNNSAYMIYSTIFMKRIFEYFKNTKTFISIVFCDSPLTFNSEDNKFIGRTTVGHCRMSMGRIIFEASVHQSYEEILNDPETIIIPVCKVDLPQENFISWVDDHKTVYYNVKEDTSVEILKIVAFRRK